MNVILIVDDEYDIVSSLEMTFTLEGFQVLTAFNGKEALALLEGPVAPDLVISDLMMPEMDGYAFLKALRSTPAGQAIRVILMSAAPLNESRLEPGSWDLFIRKPFSLDRLIAHVETLLAAPPRGGQA